MGIRISKATFYKYERTVILVEEFLQFRFMGNQFLLHKIDVDFLEGLFSYLRLQKGLAHNTILKYFQFLKVLLGPPISSGIIKQDPFKKLSNRPKPVCRSFLNQEELRIIEKLEIETPDLLKKKDIFLFACYTGLSYIDIKNLQRSHIIRDNEGDL